MESLKSFDELCAPDSRQENFVVLNHENETYRPRTLEDIYEDVETIKLVPDVPEDIQGHFSAALNLLIYSWFHYPFNVTCESALKMDPPRQLDSVT